MSLETSNYKLRNKLQLTEVILRTSLLSTEGKLPVSETDVTEFDPQVLLLKKLLEVQ